jgi:hypothetical protein
LAGGWRVAGNNAPWSNANCEYAALSNAAGESRLSVFAAIRATVSELRLLDCAVVLFFNEPERLMKQIDHFHVVL